MRKKCLVAGLLVAAALFLAGCGREAAPPKQSSYRGVFARMKGMLEAKKPMIEAKLKELKQKSAKGEVPERERDEFFESICLPFDAILAEYEVDIPLTVDNSASDAVEEVKSAGKLKVLRGEKVSESITTLDGKEIGRTTIRESRERGREINSPDKPERGGMKAVYPINVLAKSRIARNSGLEMRLYGAGKVAQGQLKVWLNIDALPGEWTQGQVLIDIEDLETLVEMKLLREGGRGGVRKEEPPPN